MTEKTRSSIFVAVLFTLVALGGLVTCLLLLRRNTSGGLLAFGLPVSALLVVLAIGRWVICFRRWVDFEIESRQKAQARTSEV